jgi:hypothetical protein
MRFSTFRLLIALTFLLSCGGTCLSVWGWLEWRVGQHSTAEPVAVDLAALEAGEPLPSNHVTIGPHYACYEASVYEYLKDKDSHATPEARTKLSYCLYPIVSMKDPQAQKLVRLQEQFGSLKKVPDDVKLPQIEQFAVVVKTERFKTVGDIPDDTVRREESVQGLVINEIRSLKADEKRLLEEQFPTVDLKKVLLLEEGRRPSSSAVAGAAMVGGIGLLAVGVLGGLVVIVSGLAGLVRRMAGG